MRCILFVAVCGLASGLSLQSLIAEEPKVEPAQTLFIPVPAQANTLPYVPGVPDKVEYQAVTVADLAALNRMFKEGWTPSTVVPAANSSVLILKRQTPGNATAAVSYFVEGKDEKVEMPHWWPHGASAAAASGATRFYVSKDIEKRLPELLKDKASVTHHDGGEIMLTESRSPGSFVSPDTLARLEKLLDGKAEISIGEGNELKLTERAAK